MKTQLLSDKGFYGIYGGAYIPEMLYAVTEELRENYLKIIETDLFKQEMTYWLNQYVGRPTPLFYASRLSEIYQANIYLKREDLNHTGAHKINNAIGQILLAKAMGKKNIVAETGAGQHGVATATVCALMNLPCIIYMGALDIKRQAPNVARMKMLGAEVIAVESGSKTLKDATNEAIRHWINHSNDTYYIIGSVVGPHPYPDLVARFQSVISLEMKAQLYKAVNKESPDYIIACVGGGSNAAGAFYHFIGNGSTKLIGVEAAGEGIHTVKTAATMTIGKLGIIHGCKTLMMQTDDGQIIEPYSISAGLDYPGIGPLHAYLSNVNMAEYLSVTDDEALTAGYQLASLEGIIPALESAHALAALNKIHFQKDDVVVVNLSGRGDKDMETYIHCMDKFKTAS
ncbi:MAG: tryptophan synthase subunit beta [Bacteroidota bacterium]